MIGFFYFHTVSNVADQGVDQTLAFSHRLSVVLLCTAEVSVENVLMTSKQIQLHIHTLLLKE